MGIADRKVLLVDSSKFGVTALNRLVALDAFDDVITDAGLPEKECDLLRQQGVRLTIADG
jgi:DeoR/GlpR family transcriptional regulator of sugar metabolism